MTKKCFGAMKSIFSPRVQPIFGWALVAISFGVGLLTLGRGVFGDEADNLVVGSLISQGESLYRDVFSHHFPFPYYWMALVAGLFGKSIVIARLSVLVFQTTAFALGMKLSANYWLVGLTAILWSIVRPFYLGNMVLYNSFTGAAIWLVFITTLALLGEHSTAGWKHWLTIGAFSAIAILSDPLSIYAVALALLILLIKKPVWAGYPALVLVGILVSYSGYLWLSGTFPAFWSSTIDFNTQVYAKYIDANPNRIGEFLKMVIQGLEITDRVWFDLDPFKPVSAEYAVLDRWLFTGFLYRLAILATAVSLLVRKRYAAAAFLYLFAAATLTINKWDFRAQSFVLVSLTALAGLLTDGWGRDIRSKALRIMKIIVGAIVLVMATWLSYRLVDDLSRDPDTYGEVHFTDFMHETERLQELTCHQPDVSLAYYPGGTYYYWFTGMDPVAGYGYMWPWVAESGLDAVTLELGQVQALAIVVMQHAVVWNVHDTNAYLRPLHEFLEENYHLVDDGTYLSPALYYRCSD